MTLAYQTAERNPIVGALVPDSGPLGEANLNIHAADEMLLHYLGLHHGDRDQALVLYFDSGRRIWETMRDILRWRFGGFGSDFQLLDFASGYGRVTRFAVLDVPPGRVWVSDIYAGGVRFQEEEFGVHALVSHADPGRFECPETFDAILVSSLFTHLPEVTFRSWLARLWGLLRPGGMLAFSVHDEDLLAVGGDRTLPASGILFDASSESGSLPTEQYGTTWVNEAFVRRMVTETAPGSSVHRIPRGMLRFQDLYVVVPEPDADFSGLHLQAEPEGFVEHCSVAGGSLRMAGWIVDRVRRAAPREVRLTLDGEVFVQRQFEPRDDVAVLFPYEKVEGYGWRFIAELPPGAVDRDVAVVIEVVDSAGGESKLYEDRLSAALVRAARLDLHHVSRQLAVEREKTAEANRTIGYLRSLVAGMESSRFWKLRNVWFRIKEAVRG